jgi:hypothetical protein
MMGMQVASAQLFYDFCLDDHVPADHLLRRIESPHFEIRPVQSGLCCSFEDFLARPMTCRR